MKADVIALGSLHAEVKEKRPGPSENMVLLCVYHLAPFCTGAQLHSNNLRGAGPLKMLTERLTSRGQRGEAAN